MQFNLEKLDKNFVTLEINVNPDEIEEALSQAYRKVVQKINLPGFRKGHIPRHILEAQYGKTVLYEDALDILVPDAYLKALKEYNLEPIDQPKFDVVDALESGKPFVFKATVEVLPEVKLGEYKGLEIEKPMAEIGDKEVTERLEALRERNSELVLSDKTTLENGDFAVIDFEGFLDGKPFAGGASQNYSLEIGSGNFIPGFEEQLIGQKTGEIKEIKVTFPADYHSQDLAGKETTFKVTLKEIKVKELPELDDEFAKSMGKFETLVDLKEDLQKKMTVTAEQEIDANFTRDAVDKAVQNAETDVPAVMIEREIEELMHRFEHNLAYQGLDFDQYLEYSKKTKEDVAADFRPEAAKNVKTDLVLSAIAKAEDLNVSDAELDERIQELAVRYQQKNAAKLRKDLESKGRLDDIKQAILLEKATDLVKNNAVAQEVKAKPAKESKKSKKQ